MSFPEDKGYVRARVISLTPPDDKAAIWAVGADENSITDHRLYRSGSWVSIEGIVYSATAPSNTNVIWIKTGGLVPVIHTYDGASWVPLTVFSIIDVSTGTTISSNEVSGQLLKSTATTTQTIILDAGVPSGTAFRAMRLGTGALRIEASAGVKINGITAHTVEIAAQWNSAWAICLGNDEWLIEGYLL